MGQPTPPGDMPLFEGLGVEWNDIVGALPEDRRSELAPKIKERLSEFEPLKQWEDLHKSGITPELADTALRLLTTVENDPRQVYDTLGSYLKITPAEAKKVVEEIKQGDPDDPRIATMQEQINTLGQVLLAERQLSKQEHDIKEQESALDKELIELKKKYGEDVPEDEILMRMSHKNMTAEQAYQEYASRADAIRSRRPAPFVLGTGGVAPNRTIDPTKLDSEGTKSLVAQMMRQANSDR